MAKLFLKIYPMASKIPKVGSKIGQIQNKPCKNHQILKECGQNGNGESPSLVTLNKTEKKCFYILSITLSLALIRLGFDLLWLCLSISLLC